MRKLKGLNRVGVLARELDYDTKVKATLYSSMMKGKGMEKRSLFGQTW